MTVGPINDPYEAIEQAQNGEIAPPDQPPMDDPVSRRGDEDESENN